VEDPPEGGRREGGWEGEIIRAVVSGPVTGLGVSRRSPRADARAPSVFEAVCNVIFDNVLITNDPYSIGRRLTSRRTVTEITAPDRALFTNTIRRGPMIRVRFDPCSLQDSDGDVLAIVWGKQSDDLAGRSRAIRN